MTRLITEPYPHQARQWPQSGRHILAQYDAESVIVYQAYRPAIGRYAAAHGYFGGEFSFTRMTWIKPNFLWMMYRSGWGVKEGQEVTLAIRLRRDAFDSILSRAVPSSFDPASHPDATTWKDAVGQSTVRLQWDPDHDPSGGRVERRAIQLGMRGPFWQPTPATGSSASRTSLPLSPISGGTRSLARPMITLSLHVRRSTQSPTRKRGDGWGYHWGI